MMAPIANLELFAILLGALIVAMGVAPAPFMLGAAKDRAATGQLMQAGDAGIDQHHIGAFGKAGHQIKPASWAASWSTSNDPSLLTA